MSNRTNSTTSPALITRVALSHLMALARDTSLSDDEIRAVAHCVNHRNINEVVDSFRVVHTIKSSFAQSNSRASPEMGAVLCAETFYSLCEEDRVKLRELSLFCPFTLAYKSCVHGNRCQLKNICYCWVCDRHYFYGVSAKC